MTIAEHSLTEPRTTPEADARDAALEIGWPCLVLSNGHAGGGNGSTVPTIQRGELSIIVDETSDQPQVTAWLELDHDRRDLLDREAGEGEISRHDGLLHIDYRIADRRILALTLRDDGRVMYAQSALLTEAGLPGGCYEPPRLRRFDADALASLRNGH